MKSLQIRTKNGVKTAKGEMSSVLVVGDIASSGLSSVQGDTFDYFYAPDILKVLHNKDVSLGNLECPLTDINEPIVKSGPNLRGRPEDIEFFKAGGFDIAVLANNHIMDHGAAGLQETLSVCERIGLKTIGVGANLEVACRPLFIEIRGLRIVFLAFTEEEFSCATEITPGAAKLDLTVACSAIRKAKEDSDVVIVNVHGGNEFYPIPSPRMQSWYRFLAECGADAIIGHHPHTLQGVEIYKNVPIIYSLGNFIFPTKVRQPKCWYQGLIIRLIIADKKVSTVEIYPCEQVVSNGKLRVDLLKHANEVGFSARFDRLCQIAGDAALAREFWKCFCFYKRKFYLSALKITTAGLKADLSYVAKKAVRNGNISYLLCILADYIDYLYQKKSVKKQKVTELKNLFLCPAHHEVLATIIEMDRLGVKPTEGIWSEFEELMRDCV